MGPPGPGSWQLDVEAALRRHLAIPQTRDRRYNIKLRRCPGLDTLACKAYILYWYARWPWDQRMA